MAQKFERAAVAEYASMYSEGCSISEIAGASVRSYTQIGNILVKSGVKLRTKKEAAERLILKHLDWETQFLRPRIRIYDEQKAEGRHLGVFNDCSTKKDEVMSILRSWYSELRGD